MPYQKLSKKHPAAFLGFVGVVVSVAVLTVNQSPPTQAQTESYITDADEAAACEGVCNTFVPPQTEEECEELRSERLAQAYNDHALGTARNGKRRQKGFDLSSEVYFSEHQQYLEEYNESVAAAKKVATAALAAAYARLTACTLACQAVVPISWTAVALCWSQHAVAQAGIWLTYDRAVDGFGERFDERNDAARDRQEARDFRIQTNYEEWMRELDSWYGNEMALIESDYLICLERVNN